MKRKHASKEAVASKEVDVTMADTAETSSNDLKEMDVEAFLLRDCKASSKKIVEQAKVQVEELRRELEKGKQLLRDAFQAEKENVGDGIVAFTIAVECKRGPYQGRKFSMVIDSNGHPSCFIGRSTNRKFRSPHGLSMPNDSELSTTHGEIRVDPTGKLFFIDLDSTNGSRIDGVELEAEEPYELTQGKPIKVEIGAGEYEFVFEQKSR
ncbi:hypothetical protein PsorP6_005479 [Peronosclerospora sorghi]|uniref:Uncharacterized protein n=1 Tax=Peronosclerospora sorghi TaxID=230839 RepID=A0ACC0W2L1_9STRA|nr:hypothetical protein PsorP6_005479 [Peronosclerospora sorghi]